MRSMVEGADAALDPGNKLKRGGFDGLDQGFRPMA